MELILPEVGWDDVHMQVHQLVTNTSTSILLISDVSDSSEMKFSTEIRLKDNISMNFDRTKTWVR